MRLLITLVFLLNIPHAFATDDWKLVAQEDSITIYAGPSGKSGVIPFKAIANIDSPLSAVVGTIKDYRNKHKWAPKLKKVTMHKESEKDEYLFSEYYKTPWPATDREFLLQGKVNYISKNEVHFLAHSVDNSFKDDDHIQADVDMINVKLVKVEQNKTQIEFAFHGDMKGWMPVWLMNLIQKKWPLRFIQGLRKQVASVGKDKALMSQN